jgi:hypothetical protein
MLGVGTRLSTLPRRIGSDRHDFPTANKPIQGRSIGHKSPSGRASLPADHRDIQDSG